LICRVVKVWERLRIAVVAGRYVGAEGFESGHGSDPGGDGGGEAFGEEGAEGLVFPGLDVAGGPVVEETYAEDMVRCGGDGNGRSERIGLADVKGEFELIVEGSGGAEAGTNVGARWARLAVRALDGDAAEQDGGGSSVVADGDVLVVGQERLVGTEETAYAGGVMDGGVEVGVVGDVDGVEEGCTRDGVKGRFSGTATAGFRADVKEGGEGFAEERPGAWAESHERVEDGSLTDGGETGWDEAGVGAGVEIEQVGADGDAEVLLAFALKGAVGEVGQGEAVCRIIGCGEPTLMGGGSSLGHGGMIARSLRVKRPRKQ
jgi:hypothetical protein